MWGALGGHDSEACVAAALSTRASSGEASLCVLRHRVTGIPSSRGDRRAQDAEERRMCLNLKGYIRISPPIKPADSLAS